MSIFLSALLFSLPAFGAATWRRQDSGTFAWLRSLYFFDQTRGFVVGSNGTVLRTADGGAHWQSINAYTRDNLRDIVFTDDNNGWILAERSAYAIKKNVARSYLLRTADAGATWKAVEFRDNPLNALLVRFVADRAKQKILAIGENGALYALAAGGAWQKQAAPTEYLLLGGFATDAQQAWLVGAGSSVLSTADAGATWRAASFNDKRTNQKSRFHAAFFHSAKKGWIVGAAGKILTTSNGVNWRERIAETDHDLLDVQFVDEKNGWIAGDLGTLLRTADAGATWQAEPLGDFARRLERLFVARQPDGKTRGFAVGFGGTILALAE